MFIYTTHTASTTKSKHDVRHCEEERRSNLIQIVRLLLRQLADRNDGSVIILNIPLTKDLPCGILANALPGRRDVINTKLNFIYHEQQINSAPEMHNMRHEHRN